MSNMIYKKMSDVMKAVGHVSKDQKNVAQGFKFRGIDQFVNALYPALTANGVFMTPRAVRFDQEVKDVTRSNGKAGVDKHVSIMMEYDFFAEDGSKVTVGPIPAEGLDSGDKATNKALSAALKYALIQTFSIPTEDMAEADFETPELGRFTPAKASNVTVAAVARTLDTTISVTTDKNKPVISSEEVSRMNPNPEETQGTVVSTSVEPLKKSSFRKPGKKAEVADTSGADTSWS